MVSLFSYAGTHLNINTLSIDREIVKYNETVILD